MPLPLIPIFAGLAGLKIAGDIVGSERRRASRGRTHTSAMRAIADYEQIIEQIRQRRTKEGIENIGRTSRELTRQSDQGVIARARAQGLSPGDVESLQLPAQSEIASAAGGALRGTLQDISGQYDAAKAKVPFLKSQADAAYEESAGQENLFGEIADTVSTFGGAYVTHSQNQDLIDTMKTSGTPPKPPNPFEQIAKGRPYLPPSLGAGIDETLRLTPEEIVGKGNSFADIFGKPKGLGGIFGKPKGLAGIGKSRKLFRPNLLSGGY